MKSRRPTGLIAIVLYKSFVAVLLAITAICIFFALKNFPDLQNFAETYLLETKVSLIEWAVDRILNLDPRTLKFAGVVAAIYSLVTAIEAIGLWYEKSWARYLVIALVGASILPEFVELTRGITFWKLAIFTINGAVLWWLIRYFPKHPG